MQQRILIVCLPAHALCMQASVPGLALWMDLVNVLRERSNWTDTDIEHNNPIYQTGPLALAAAIERNSVPPFTMKKAVSAAFAAPTHRP